MVTPYEVMIIPARRKRMIDTFDAARKRKDYGYDMRFKSSRAAAKLERRLCRLAELRYEQEQ